MAFTPVDFIAGLAALNKGDVGGFRQSFSREGRQQIETERGLQSERLAQEKALAQMFSQYLQGVRPDTTPGALAHRTSMATMGQEETKNRMLPGKIGTEIQAGQAGIRQADASTRGMDQQHGITAGSMEWMKDPRIAAFLAQKMGLPGGTQPDFGMTPGLIGQANEERRVTAGSEANNMNAAVELLKYAVGDPRMAPFVNALFKKMGLQPEGGTQAPGGGTGQAILDAYGKDPGVADVAKDNPFARFMVGGPLAMKGAPIQTALGESMVSNPLEATGVPDIARPSQPIPEGIGPDELQAALELIRQLTENRIPQNIPQPMRTGY